MSVGSEGATVLLVAGEGGVARDIAAGVEAADWDVSVVTATGLEEAGDRLDDVDGAVVVLGDLVEDWEAAVADLTEGADAPVVVDTGSRADATEAAAVAAGATDAVAAEADADAVLANRLELAVRAATAERSARETQHRYHRLLEASPAAIVIYDAEGTILYANRAAADAVSAEDPYGVVDRPIFEFIAGEHQEAIEERFRTVIEDREPVEAREIAVEGIDGQRRYLEAAGSPVTVDGEPGGQAVLTDVTKLKERERRLRTERDRFTALFESLPEPAVHVRYEDGEPVVQNVNPAFEDVFGYDEATVLDESLAEFVVPDGAAEGPTEFERIADEGGQIEQELQRRADGRVREFLFRAQSMETAEGTDEGVGIYVDITERKHREEALERQNERLDAFASIVSHDLQSPLSVAKGNLFLAKEEGDEQYLEKAETAMDRMKQIIDDLLRLAKRGEQGIEREPVEGRTVVTEAWTEIDVVGAELVNDLDRTVLADRGQLRELLTNLLRNAVEHGSTSPQHAGDAVEHGATAASGGEVDSHPADGGADRVVDVTIEVGTLADGFYVADDGPGIPADEREEVFEPGYTTHETGTGFGLVVVAEIAQAHGWQPSVTESDRGGARFEFRGVDFVEEG